MRKLVLVFVFLVGVLQANAQSADSVEVEAAVIAKATEESEQWQRTLQLTKDQFLQLKAANVKRTALLDEAKKKHKYELELRDQAIRQLEAQFDAVFGAILDTKQFAGYLELQGRTAAETISYKNGATGTTDQATSEPTQPANKAAISLSGGKSTETKEE